MHNRRPNSITKEKILFSLIIILQFFIFFYLIFQRRIVGGHDGFYHFGVQYYFLNHTAVYGEIPQWIPYITHGVTAAWSYAIHGMNGLLPNVFFHMKGLLKNFDFISIYYLGIFFEEFILFIGTWLLARRFYSSVITGFFVSVCVLGSSIWMMQLATGLHVYYVIPLILHFFHSFLETSKWRYFFLGANLFIIQTICNVAYFIPMISLIIFLYFLFYIIGNENVVWKQVKHISWKWPAVLSIFGVMISFIPVYKLMKIGSEGVVTASVGRSDQGVVGIDMFLKYGGDLSLSKWLEIFFGVSPALDYTLYFGFFSFVFVVFGLIFNMRKNNMHFFLTALTMLLFSMGSFVAVFFYHFWPLMKFYRHIALVSVVVKMFFCFVAGFGFEAVVMQVSYKWKRKVIVAGLILSSVVMIFLSFKIFSLAGDNALWSKLVHSMIQGKLPETQFMGDPHQMSTRFYFFGGMAMVSAIVLGACVFVHRVKYRAMLIGLVLLIHVVNLYGYKFSEIHLRTIPLKQKEYQHTTFQVTPYVRRRALNFDKNHPRASMILNLLSGTKYGSIANSFMFNEQVGSSFRMDYWLSPFDQFMKAFWGQNIHDTTQSPRGFRPYKDLIFPLKHPAARKFAGLTEDKIQIFSNAHGVDGDNGVASVMTSSEYTGDTLLVLHSQQSQNKKLETFSYFTSGRIKALKSLSKENIGVLQSNERLNIPYKVTDFNSNHVKINVNVLQDSAWLFYSDIWHPSWQATVNGVAVPVFKANLAYKAVPLNQGQNDIHFFFRPRNIILYQKWIGLNAAFWVGMIFWLTIQVFRKDEEPVIC